MAAPEAPLSYLLAEKNVDDTVQQAFVGLGITSVRLFALMAEDRKELKDLLNDEPFNLKLSGDAVSAQDKLQARVSIAKITDAWMVANTRMVEKLKVEAEQRAAGVTLSMPQGEHVELKLSYEAKFDRTAMKDYPSDALIERRFTEIDQGDLKAESLQDVASKDEQADDPQDAVWYQGAFKVKRSLTRVTLPRNTEELRSRVALLGITYVVARLKHPGHAWLATATPDVFRMHTEYILGKRVHGLRIKVGGEERTPPWTLVLSYEHEVRKAAVEKISYERLDLAAALKAVYADVEHRQLNFLTPAMGLMVQAPDHVRRPEVQTREVPGWRSESNTKRKKTKGSKGDGKGKGHHKGAFDQDNLAKKTADGKDICFNWNRKGGCAAKHCSRAHVCRICFGPHPACEHVGPR